MTTSQHCPAPAPPSSQPTFDICPFRDREPLRSPSPRFLQHSQSCTSEPGRLILFCSILTSGSRGPSYLLLAIITSHEPLPGRLSGRIQRICRDFCRVRTPQTAARFPTCFRIAIDSENRVLIECFDFQLETSHHRPLPCTTDCVD